LKPAVTKAYYVSMTGDDGWAGTEAAPLRKIKTAIAKADITHCVLLDQGPYDQSNGLLAYIITKSVALIGHPLGTLVHGFYTGLVWAINDPGNYPHVYHVTQASASSWAFDSTVVDAKGDYSQLAAVASVAAVEAAPGSIYINGSEIYVRLAGDRAPDDDVRISSTASDNFRFVPTSGTKTCYVENFRFEGGKEPALARAGAGVTANLYMRNCTMKYGEYADNFYIAGNVKLIAQNCQAALAIGDGFNYIDYSSQTPSGIEINCIGRNNGDKVARDDNGSTGHAGALIVRLDGLYYGNAGRNVHDITGSKSWNLGCVAHTPNLGKTGSEGQANANFASGDASLAAAGPMWNDHCVSYGAVSDLEEFEGGDLRTKKCQTKGVVIGTPTEF
jgi:hypothetical protein